jgi:hypothetical protein
MESKISDCGFEKEQGMEKKEIGGQKSEIRGQQTEDTRH